MFNLETFGHLRLAGKTSKRRIYVVFREIP
jgi:hypothetical protein